MSTVPAETKRLAISRGRDPVDAHTPILQALGLTASEAARKAGWSPVPYSRCRAGKAPVPEARARAMQEATRSPAFPTGIRPTARFWPAGMRVWREGVMSVELVEDPEQKS